eukprot:s861_g24.t1
MTALALAWNWPSFVAVTLIGFLCMLHPSEFLYLRRADLILPSDAMASDRVAYIHLRNPKTARFARRQHCRLEDKGVLNFLEAFCEAWSPDRLLYSGTANTYRTQWNAVMRHLGVPHNRASKGATPGVLRGSGATYLYLETEDLSKVQWRGRWARLKTVEFYLQEAMSSNEDMDPSQVLEKCIAGEVPEANALPQLQHIYRSKPRDVISALCDKDIQKASRDFDGF